MSEAKKSEFKLDAFLSTDIVGKKHPKCRGTYDSWNGDFDCDYGTTLTCEQCKYGMGRKDPEAKCNR
jgi:hypothetical protein